MLGIIQAHANPGRVEKYYSPTRADNQLAVPSAGWRGNSQRGDAASLGWKRILRVKKENKWGWEDKWAKSNTERGDEKEREDEKELKREKGLGRERR